MIIVGFFLIVIISLLGIAVASLLLIKLALIVLVITIVAIYGGCVLFFSQLFGDENISLILISSLVSGSCICYVLISYLNRNSIVLEPHISNSEIENTLTFTMIQQWSRRLKDGIFLTASKEQIITLNNRFNFNKNNELIEIRGFIRNDKDKILATRVWRTTHLSTELQQIFGDRSEIKVLIKHTNEQEAKNIKNSQTKRKFPWKLLDKK